MTIKSNKETKKFDLGLKAKFSKYHIILLTIVFVILSYNVWDYSGPLSISLMITAVALIANYKPLSGSYRHNYGSRDYENFTVMMILGHIGLAWAMTANIYADKPTNANVEVSKLEFIDSTEKMVAFIEKPMKKTLVIDTLSSEKYFTVKDKKLNDFNITYQSTSSRDYWDKMFDAKPSQIDKRFVFKYDDGIIEWTNNKD